LCIVQSTLELFDRLYMIKRLDFDWLGQNYLFKVSLCNE
jgi:hypothetical protein